MKQNTEKSTEQSEAVDFLGTLVVLNRGNTVIDASRELQAVIDGVVNANKAGELTIKLKIEPTGWKKGTSRVNQVDIEPQISSKVPQPSPNKSIFFVTEENALTRDDPEQDKLFS
jgi:hypothetical protein